MKCLEDIRNTRALKIFQEYEKFSKIFCKKIWRCFSIKFQIKQVKLIVKGKTFFEAWKENPEDQYFSLISYFNDDEKEKLLNFSTSLPSRRFIDKLFLESKKCNANIIL